MKIEASSTRIRILLKTEIFFFVLEKIRVHTLLESFCLSTRKRWNDGNTITSHIGHALYDDYNVRRQQFSSPEPLGLICNRPDHVTKKRRALGTRMDVSIFENLCFRLSTRKRWAGISVSENLHFWRPKTPFECGRKAMTEKKEVSVF